MSVRSCDPRDLVVGSAPQQQLHADLLQRLLEQLRSLALLARHEVLLALDEHHLGAKQRERLRHLAAHGAAANDGEAGRQGAEVEDRRVGPVAALGEAWHARDRGAT